MSDTFEIEQTPAPTPDPVTPTTATSMGSSSLNYTDYTTADVYRSLWDISVRRESGSDRSSGSSEEKYGIESGKGYYGKSGKNTVTYYGPSLKTSAKTAAVPSTVKIGNKTYKVTKIASFAFTGYDNLTSVTIGNNVSTIAFDAFNGCDKLKVLKIRSNKLKKKNIKNCLRESGVKTITVMKPAWEKLNLYKKIFTRKNTGAKYKVKVRKSK